MKVVVNVFLLVLFASISNGDGRDWIRGFMGTPKDENTPLVRCVIISVASTRGHLDGNLLFINDSNFKIEIEGEMRKDGVFWPCFAAEVMSEGEKGWRTIGESTKLQGVTTYTVDAFSELPLHADMDIFRPMIAEADYGRIRLSNGIWAMFDLKLLVDD